MRNGKNVGGFSVFRHDPHKYGISECAQIAHMNSYLFVSNFFVRKPGGNWTEVEEILDNYDFSLHDANKYPEIINIINNTVDKNSSTTEIKKPPGNIKVYSKK